MLGQVTEKEAIDRAPKLSHLGVGVGDSCPVPQGKNEPNTPELFWGVQLNLTVGKQPSEENGVSLLAWEATPVYTRHIQDMLTSFCPPLSRSVLQPGFLPHSAHLQ